MPKGYRELEQVWAENRMYGKLGYQRQEISFGVNHLIVFEKAQT